MTLCYLNNWIILVLSNILFDNCKYQQSLITNIFQRTIFQQQRYKRIQHRCRGMFIFLSSSWLHNKIKDTKNTAFNNAIIAQKMCFIGETCHKDGPRRYVRCDGSLLSCHVVFISALSFSEPIDSLEYHSPLPKSCKTSKYCTYLMLEISGIPPRLVTNILMKWPLLTCLMVMADIWNNYFCQYKYWNLS